jgi:hypothetical protein
MSIFKLFGLCKISEIPADVIPGELAHKNFELRKALSDATAQVMQKTAEIEQLRAELSRLKNLHNTPGHYGVWSTCMACGRAHPQGLPCPDMRVYGGSQP